jgi:DNA transposition AAA+ family ATPase
MEEKREVAVNEELYSRFFDLVGEGKRISQSKAAQAIGYSSGVISAYKSRTYNGNIKMLEDKIAVWLKRESRRLSRIEVPVVETSSITKIKRAIALAHDEADIAVIVGDAGGGKTTGAYQYQAESHSAFLVEVDPSFTAEIARAVETVEAFARAGAGSVRSLVKLIGRVHQTLAVNNIDQPDPDAIVAASELLMR